MAFGPWNFHLNNVKLIKIMIQCYVLTYTEFGCKCKFERERNNKRGKIRLHLYKHLRECHPIRHVFVCV